MGSAIENEFKFTCGQKVNGTLVVQRLESYLDLHDISYKEKNRHSVDSYYDSGDMALYRSDRILRMKRSDSGRIKLTVKRPVSNEENMMSREEIETSSDGSMKELKAFARENLPDVEIADDPVLKIDCTRTAIYYQDGSEILLSFDHCKYLSGRDCKEFYEIELESMDDSTERGFDRIEIRAFIESELGFEPTVKSKYQRGIEWKETLRCPSTR
jgi:inorganic triphosphatase YgiF